jgi:hypothetical protein
MKLSIFAIAALAIVACSCTPSQSTSEEISWNAFCQQRGYALNDKSDTAVNDYLDTWRGSADEDAALEAAGVQAF